ncbi:hypothetical protein Dimus_017410 [Dionaea muscipula]
MPSHFSGAVIDSLSSSISTSTLNHFCNGRIFTFEMHHGYSDQVKLPSTRASRLRGGWPAKGRKFEYCTELAEVDRFFFAALIAEIEKPVTSFDGNAAFRISSSGFLHYTMGTPWVKFLPFWWHLILGGDAFLGLADVLDGISHHQKHTTPPLSVPPLPSNQEKELLLEQLA